ncbi:MAG: carbohydrate ABC transporter permease [Spirochaetota bacterium]
MTAGSTVEGRLKRTFGAVLLWLCALIILLPLAAVLLTSLKSLRDAGSLNLSLPREPLFGNYSTVVAEGRILGSIWNSLVVTCLSTLLILLCSSMLAFILSRRRTAMTVFMEKSVTLGLVAPFTALPTILLLKTLGILGTHGAIALVYTAMFMPFTTMLLSAFVRSLPRELDEAAIIDGCSGFALFRRIILPLLQAPLMTAFLLNTMWVWNDFMIPLYLLNSAARWTLPLSVFSFFGKYNHSWQFICANMVIVSAPVTLLYLIGQRALISGITAGAVKG